MRDEQTRPNPSSNDRIFYSSLLLVFGPLALALGWLAFSSVGALMMLAGIAAIPFGFALRPTRARAIALVAGLALGLWPLTIGTWAF